MINKQRLIDKLNADEAWRVKKQRIVSFIWDTVPMVFVIVALVMFYLFIDTLGD